MAKKRFTFALNPETGSAKLQTVATHHNRSKSNMLEVLIEEAEYKIKIKTPVKPEKEGHGKNTGQH